MAKFELKRVIFSRERAIFVLFNTWNFVRFSFKKIGLRVVIFRKIDLWIFCFNIYIYLCYLYLNTKFGLIWSNFGWMRANLLIQNGPILAIFPHIANTKKWWSKKISLTETAAVSRKTVIFSKFKKIIKIKTISY